MGVHEVISKPSANTYKDYKKNPEEVNYKKLFFMWNKNILLHCSHHPQSWEYFIWGDFHGSESSGDNTEGLNSVVTHFCQGQDVHLLGPVAFCCGSSLRNYQSVSRGELFIIAAWSELLRVESA